MSVLNFFKKHSILANLLLAGLIVIILIIIVLSCLESYTNHGKAVEIPEVKGLSVEKAAPFFETKGLKYVVNDSMFVKNALPGTILETAPPIGTTVKAGRTIYLTVNSFSSQLLTIPDVIDMSNRQAISMLTSMGFDSVQEKQVPGAFRDLVMGLESGNRKLSIGDKLPSDSRLTVLVSSGTEEASNLDAKDDSETEEESGF